MREITKNLYVGNQDDYESLVKYSPDWLVIHACKEPYHRAALGYRGRAAANTDPEYLFAYRENRLILNLIDANDSKYIAKEIIDTALNYISRHIQHNKILLHCNQGQSRSPSIGFLYMIKQGLVPTRSFVEAEKAFRLCYPEYSPAKGIYDFIQQHWQQYV